MTKEDKENNEIRNILIVILVVIIIVGFILSLGQLNITKLEAFPPEIKEDKEKAKLRHKRLSVILQKQETLNLKLQKKFKQIYFFIRLGLVILWFIILLGFYLGNFIHNLGDVLNYSEASLFLLILVNFLTFGTLMNLENYINLIKIKTQNLVYGKYIKLEDQIEVNRTELNLLDRQI